VFDPILRMARVVKYHARPGTRFVAACGCLGGVLTHDVVWGKASAVLDPAELAAPSSSHGQSRFVTRLALSQWDITKTRKSVLSDTLSLER
jgi:hypothetical protein